MSIYVRDAAGSRKKIGGVGLPGPAATINGVNTLTVTAGDHIKLDQADGELKIGVNLDNGSIAGDTSLLDDLKSPGTYNWLDEEGELGITGGLWNVAVTNSAFSAVQPSITQTLVGTYGPGTKGRVLARSFYYANNPQWTPWRELASLDQISSPNLLDNWYFADPVNQRGQAEYIGAGYTIDRWITFEGGKVTVTDGGLKMSSENSPHNRINFAQILENKPMDDGIYTLSVLYNGNQLSARSGKLAVNSVAPVAGFGYARFYNTNMGFIVEFVCNIENSETVVNAVKLELGTIQTLAHQDASGNWVLSDPPPDPALELAKCQRYQFVIGNRLLAPFGTFVSRASGRASAFIPLPTMRAAPTVTFYGNFRAIASNRETVGSNLTGVISGWSASGVEIAIHSFEGLSVGDAGWLDTRDANAMVIFDANI